MSELVRDEEYGYLKVWPRPSEEEMASLYTTTYRNPCTPHDPEVQAEMVIDLYFPHRPRRVLDIGCGRGELLGAFMKKGWAVVGVEPHTIYSEQARSLGITVVTEELTPQLCHELGTFDLVCLVNVLEHLLDPEGMMKMARVLLRPQGVLYCVVPNDFNVLQGVAVETRDLRPWWVCPPDHLNYFSIESLVAFVAGHGLDVSLATTDFPMELFLLFGDIYVDHPLVGKEVHGKRCRFEEAMRRAGKGPHLEALYRALASIGMGRKAIVCASKLS